MRKARKRTKKESFLEKKYFNIVYWIGVVVIIGLIMSKPWDIAGEILTRYETPISLIVIGIFLLILGDKSHNKEIIKIFGYAGSFALIFGLMVLLLEAMISLL